MLNYLYKKYDWFFKALKSEVKVTKEGDIYLESKPLRERYFKIVDEKQEEILNNIVGKN